MKISTFFSKVTNEKKELKYLKRLVEIVDDPYTKSLLKKFLYASSFNEIENFLNSQNLIDYQLSPKDSEGNLNDLKEKIAFELNEAILKKYNS